MRSVPRQTRLIGVLALLAMAFTLTGGVPVSSAAGRAEDEIRDTFRAFFDGAWTPDKRDLLAQLDRTGPIFDALARRRKDHDDSLPSVPWEQLDGATARRIYFISDRLAQVVAGRREPGDTGWSGHLVERESGRWKIGLGTICAIAFQAGRDDRACLREQRPHGPGEARLRFPDVSSVGHAPGDMEENVQRIIATVQTFFASGLGPYRRSKVFEDGERMEKTLELLEWNFTKSDWNAAGLYWVDSVVFTSPTTADVSYRWVSRDSDRLADGAKRDRIRTSYEVVDVLLQGGRWRVGKLSFCESNDNIERYCPGGEPLVEPPELPAPRVTLRGGFPSPLPAISVVDSSGSIWVIRQGRANRWFDSGAERSMEGQGYLSAQFGPDESVYAARTTKSRVIIDRFRTSGAAETVISVPKFRGEKPTERAYDGSFAVGRYGIALLYHRPVQKWCRDDGTSCETQGTWFLELRAFGDLDQAGRRSTEEIEWDAIGANGTLGTRIDDVSADGTLVSVGSYPNKPFSWHRVVSLPDLDVDECCKALGDDDAGPAFLSPDGLQIPYIFHGDKVTLGDWQRWRALELRILDRVTGRVKVAYRPKLWSSPASLRAPIAWGGGVIAFAERGGDYNPGELVLLRLASNELFRTGITFGGMRDVDIAP